MKSAIIIVFSVLLLANAAETPTGAPEVSQATKPKSAENQVTCQSEPVLGSRTKLKRTCMTRAEWRLRSEQAKDALDETSRDR